MMIFALVTTKEKIMFFFMLLFRAHCRKYLFLSDSPMSQLGAGGSPGEDDQHDRGGTSTGGATNLSIRAFQCLWSDLNEKCWGRPLFTLSNNSWSCWQGVCNSWLLNVFPPHKLARRPPQVANFWASTQVELLNFWGSTQVIPIFQCWLMLGSSGRRASWKGKTRAFILFLCWSRNYGRVWKVENSSLPM